jgi:hypothetical protein
MMIAEQTMPEGMQPMDTAPMDGAWIVVWRDKYGLYSVRYRNGKWTMKTGRVIPADELLGWMPAP